ncbi:uncharacterized protein LOC131036253 [Cryptomeria japonica]|uniref:uncharacterized protein LOC131036253 n=1 Tax=Cryptomeria japonica TaxID=3369 RepID=UPI0027DA35C3|nr:uncharacterized protein LOC131036253 [Cryptomeria japonica]
MPTFSVIALDRILEPTTSNNNGSRNNSGSASGKTKVQDENGNKSSKKPKNVISPSLYATPQRTPIPDYPTSFNPSPYVVDHKRRVPFVVKDVKGFEPRTKENRTEGKGENDTSIVEGEAIAVSDGPEFVETTVKNKYLTLAGGLDSGDSMANEVPEDSVLGVGGLRHNFGLKEEKESDCDDEFLEVDEWKSVASSSDAESRSRRSYNFSTQTGQSEYFDAMEDIYTEDAASQTSESYNTMLQSELDRLKQNLSIEMERCKVAEETLTHMKNQWQEMAKKFSVAGLSFPSIRIGSPSQPLEESPVDVICTQIIVARLVSGAIGRGSARAELEEEMEAIIEGKNREIARLRDKLQYYEVLNHEMSQRNQEAIEIARRRRRTQKKRQRWIWGSIAVAVTIGTTALLQSYLTRSEKRDYKSPWATDADNHGTATDNLEI